MPRGSNTRRVIHTIEQKISNKAKHSHRVMSLGLQSYFSSIIHAQLYLQGHVSYKIKNIDKAKTSRTPWDLYDHVEI